MFQSFSKFYLYSKKRAEALSKDGKNRVTFKVIKYYSHDPMALRGDRTVGNYIEQGFCFLPLFWLHALFVDPSVSLTIATIYTVSRAIYPFVFGAKIPLLLALSTAPGYAVVIYLLVTLTRAVL